MDWYASMAEFENPLLLFSPVSAKKYLAVSKDSIDIIEMK